MHNNTIWFERHRPESIDEYFFQNEIDKQSLMRYINGEQIPHLLFVGSHGAGKSALAQLIIRYSGVDPADVLKINASMERGIDVVRDKITPFVETSPFGDYKIILLEEADTITASAQKSLKDLMETTSQTARFLATCNNEAGIIGPVRSRFQTYQFGSIDKGQATELVAKILLKENVEFDLDDLDLIVNTYHPDMRKMINSVQMYSLSGKLTPPKHFSVNDDLRQNLVALLTTGNWPEMIKQAKTTIADDEWDSIYRIVYENIELCPSFAKADKWNEAVIQIADYLYKHSFVSDRQINGLAMFIRLSQI